MGYNTVAVILNDALGMIGEDPGFGKSIEIAAGQWHAPAHRRDLDIAAHSSRGGVHCNAMAIVSQDHADYSQVVIVGQNSGQRACDATRLDYYAAQQMIRCLERNGYRVTKRRKPKDASDTPAPQPETEKL